MKLLREAFQSVTDSLRIAYAVGQDTEHDVAWTAMKDQQAALLPNDMKTHIKHAIRVHDEVATQAYVLGEAIARPVVGVHLQAYDPKAAYYLFVFWQAASAPMMWGRAFQGKLENPVLRDGHATYAVDTSLFMANPNRVYKVILIKVD